MHDRLVRLVLEVAVPAGTEFLHVVLRQLLLGRSDLDAGFDAISGKRTRAIKLPLVIDLLLRLGITSDKVIEALSVRLGTVGREGKVVVLEVETNAGQVNLAFHAGFLEFLGVSNARSLEHQRCAESAAGDDDLLAGFDDFFLYLVCIKLLHGHRADRCGTAIFDNDSVDLGVAHQVEVVMVPILHSQRTVWHEQGLVHLMFEWMYPWAESERRPVSLLIHLSQCSPPCPVVRSSRSSVVGMPCDSVARRKSHAIGYV